MCVWRNGEALAKVGVIYQMKILPKICFQNRLPIQIDAYYYYAVVAYLSVISNNIISFRFCTPKTAVKVDWYPSFR